MEDEEQETIQGTKQPNFLVPNEINHVVLLSELSYEISPAQKVTKTESPNIELKPLSFTVGENFFDLEETDEIRGASPKNIFIEKRGLLLIKKTKNGGWVEFQFPTMAGYSHTNKKIVKASILFFMIESATFKTDFLLNQQIIIKLKPEMQPFYLAIDKIEREIVLNIARRDKKLARQVVSAILTQV